MIHASILHEFDVLQNYAYTHGNYLLNNSQFKIFDNAYDNTRALAKSVKDLQSTQQRQKEALQRLEGLLLANNRRARKAYNKIATPYLKQRMRIHRRTNQQDTPPPMEIIPPPTSIATTSNRPAITTTRQTPRIRQQPKCYKCHQSSHQIRNCPKYFCYNCRKTQPGHLTRDCPDRNPTPDPRDGYYNDDYDHDGNLGGEC